MTDIDGIEQVTCHVCGRVHIPNMTVVKTYPDLTVVSSCRVTDADDADFRGGIAIVPVAMAEDTLRGIGFFGHGVRRPAIPAARPGRRRKKRPRKP